MVGDDGAHCKSYVHQEEIRFSLEARELLKNFGKIYLCF